MPGERSRRIGNEKIPIFQIVPESEDSIESGMRERSELPVVVVAVSFLVLIGFITDCVTRTGADGRADKCSGRVSTDRLTCECADTCSEESAVLGIGFTTAAKEENRGAHADTRAECQ